MTAAPAPDLSDEEAAVVQRFEEAEPAPESFRPLPGEVEMHRAMNATAEQLEALLTAVRIFRAAFHGDQP